MQRPDALATLAGLVALIGPASAGLIAEWDFDAHNAQDSSELSADYDLTTIGAGPGYDGGFAIFSGNAADYLETIGPGGASQFTVSLWVRTDTADQGAFKGLFSNNSGGSGVAYSWQIDNNGGSYRLAANSTPSPGAVEIGSPATDVWENIVIRKTSTGAEWWLNGTMVDSSTDWHPGGLQKFRLGINRASNNAYAMDLDRVQVWNSAENVANIYSAGRVSGTPFNGATSDLRTASNWDEGLPTTAGALNTGKIGRGLSATLNSGSGDTFADRLWVGFDGTAGTLNVTGGDTRIGVGSGDGIYVGVGHGSTGTINIAEGAILRSQGGAVRVQIGDNAGGTGSITVAGELQNFKYFDVVDGTLTMMPTGVNNSFNDTNQSYLRANATLEYVIDGFDVGTIGRFNTIGLNVNIDAAAELAITLLGTPGDYTLGQEWTLMDYSNLTGEFAQGTSFTNGQGYEFDVDYGAGANDVLVLTLIPEPTTGLLGLLASALFLRRRR